MRAAEFLSVALQSLRLANFRPISRHSGSRQTCGDAQHHGHDTQTYGEAQGHCAQGPRADPATPETTQLRPGRAVRPQEALPQASRVGGTSSSPTTSIYRCSRPSPSADGKHPITCSSDPHIIASESAGGDGRPGDLPLRPLHRSRLAHLARVKAHRVRRRHACGQVS